VTALNWPWTLRQLRFSSGLRCHRNKIHPDSPGNPKEAAAALVEN